MEEVGAGGGPDGGTGHGLQGRVYRPNVVRVGSEEAPLSARARDVWVDGLVRRYLDMQQPGESLLTGWCQVVQNWKNGHAAALCG